MRALSVAVYSYAHVLGNGVTLTCSDRDAFEQKTTPKGVADTALSVKDATLENGAVVKVPLFIEVGNQVRVATEDGSYVDKL